MLVLLEEVRACCRRLTVPHGQAFVRDSVKRTAQSWKRKIRVQQLQELKKKKKRHFTITCFPVFSNGGCFYYYQTLYNQMFSRSSATQAAGAKKESIKKNEQVLHHRHKFSGQTLSSQAEVLPFHKTTQFQSFGLAMRRMLMEASICWRDGSWWRGGSCSRADKKQHRGGQGKVREGKMETL